jgi:integrase
VNQNPIKPTIELVIKYLTDMYNKGAGYVSINTARSALSTILGSVDGYSIGCHPLVSRLLKGVSRLRPPRPKYDSVWDASTILNLIKSWPKNEELSFKMLSYKLVALLALCSAQRVQTLACLNLDEINFKDSEVDIKVSSRLKTTKPGQGLSLHFSKFDDPVLCLFGCLRCYIDRSQNLRKDNNLLICTRSPYKHASSQTISRWLKDVIKLAGIDVNKFSSHSFRHSSTSKASELGLSLDVIYKAAGWSEKSKVFANFYKRPIVSHSQFSNAILSSAN